MVVEITKDRMMDTFRFFLSCVKNSDSENNLMRHYKVCNAYITVMYIEHMITDEEHTELIKEVGDVFFKNKYFKWDLL